MKQKTACKRGAVIGILLLFVTTLFSLPASAVTPSKTEYTVLLNEATDFFISNKLPVDTNRGQEVYIVYTVESVDAATTSKQHGVAANDNNTDVYPYEKGGQLKFGTGNILLKEGYTYFLKLTRGKDGISYVAAQAIGSHSEYISFSNSFGKATADFKFFGLWFGDGQVTAKLSHVLCYDQNGNDLGISFLEGRGVSFAEKPLKADSRVKRFYTVSVADAVTVALSNEKPTDSNIVYMEYTVKANASKIYQTGVIHTAMPSAVYPFSGGGGLLRFEALEKPGGGYLLETGAAYIIRFVRGEDTFQATVQKSINGKTEMHKFSLTAGDYLKDAGYFSLWFGEGPNYPVDFELQDFKCYDQDGNDLGVQANVPVKVTAFGEVAEYTGCQAMYLDKETGNTVALYANKSAKVTEDGKTVSATYEIRDGKLYITAGSQKKTYDYEYRYFTSAEGRKYDRLGTYRLSFVTDEDEEPQVQVLSLENGYIAQEPAKPVKEGAEFQGWFLSDGTEFTFGELLDRSVTLYAKWSGQPAYKSVTAQQGVGQNTLFHSAPFIAVSISLLVIAIGVVAGFILYRRGKKV